MVNTFRYRRGGDSAYALGLEELLAAQGHEVIPFAMHHPDELPSPYARYFAPEIDYPALMQEGGLRNAWKVLSGSIHNREARAGIASLWDDHPPDLVHVHSVMHHLTASVLRECYARDLPVVWTLHDLKSVCPTSLYLREGRICEECSGGRFYNAVRHRCKRGNLGASLIVATELYLHRLWRIYEQADLLIAPSRFLRDKLLESGLKPRRIEVVPNHVATEGIEPTPPGDYVLYVGRVSREKGVATLMEACSRGAGIPLKVAGTGELLEEFRARAEREGWRHIQFLGHRSGPELEDLYRHAAVVAVPSEAQENCPLVVLEAFAWGKPVVGSRRGGLVELLDGQGVGELVPAGEPQAWAEALSSWMADPRRCAEAGKAARALAESTYSPDVHAERIQTLYREVLGARQVAS